MATRRFDPPLIVLWWTSGALLCFWSAQTALHALSAGRAHNTHIALLALFEAVSAVLFLVPRTLRIGSAGLLLSIAFALLAHGMDGQFRGDLLLDAVVVAFVALRGPAR